MNLISSKNFIFVLAAILVVALGIMAYSISKQNQVQNAAIESDFEKELMQIESQSESSDIPSIEEDLNSSDYDTLDKELDDIETELNY